VIVKISRGTDIGGLVRYLLGPGRANEHTAQQVVAMSEGLDAGLIGRSLSKDEIRALTQELDYLRAAHGVPTGAKPRVRVADGNPLEGEEPGIEKKTPGIVWHLSLSNPVEDRMLSDDEWRAIAQDAMEAMGFTEASGKPPVRWVAIRHGLSAAGNDHLHVAVSLVREDGTKASVFRDYKTMSAYAANVERTYGLSAVKGRSTTGLPGVTRAELERAKREGRAEPQRTTLARLVREAAVSSGSEAEFVHQLRQMGLSVRPRFADASQDTVVGYSVGVPEQSGRTILYGGGSLAPDLSLPKLRQFWETSPAETRAAVETWRGAAGPETTYLPSRGDAHRIAAVLAFEYLDVMEIPLDDHAQWASVAREMAGVYAAWSRRVEGTTPGPLARAADALAVSAQVAPNTPSPVRPAGLGFRSAAMVVAQSTRHEQGGAGWDMVLYQLGRTLGLLADVHQARREVHQAGRLRLVDRDLLRLEQRNGDRPRTEPSIGSARSREMAQEYEDEEAMARHRHMPGPEVGFGR